MNEPSRKFGSWSEPTWWNFLVTLPWCIGFVLLVYSGISDRIIATRQRTALGLITAHEPANHNRYGYVFGVEGKSYTGWESPRKDELKIGKQVVVYYDPHDPAKNALTEFGELGIEKFGPIPTLMFGIGAVALYIFWTRRKKLATTRPAV
jgi:hypothetical protein